MYQGEKSKSKIRIVKSMFLGSLVFLMITASARCVEQSAEATDIPAGAVEVGVFKNGRLSLIAFEKDTGIKDALRVLGALYKKNIVPSQSVDGVLGFTRLRDVTFEDAMNAILGDNFKYELKGNLTKVYTRTEYQKLMSDPERMVYQVFTLYYISAAEAKKLITPLLSTEGGRIETTSAAMTDFPTGESISAGKGGGDNLAMHDTIVVFDFPENIEAVAEVLDGIDVRPKQVLVEATILNVTLTEGMELGVDWSTLEGVVSQIPGVVSMPGDIVRGGVDNYAKSQGTGQVTRSGGLFVGFTEDDVGVFIRAVEQVSDVTVLANPKILAVNKQLGQVYIGKKIGYLSQQTVSMDTQLTSQVDFLDTGTKLAFRPYIANDGYIRMDIHPKDSSGNLVEGLPEEISAELVSNIIVKDGQTVVIGGLFRDKVTTNKTQVPLLGNLPIVGALFRGTSDSVERQEVIVLLTPHIIEEPSETEGQKRADDIRRKRFGAKDAMLGIGRSRLAQELYAEAVRCYVEGDHKAAMHNLGMTLTLWPQYLEAIRLKERIIAETDPDEVENLERIMLENVDRQEASKWIRR